MSNDANPFPSDKVFLEVIGTEEEVEHILCQIIDSIEPWNILRNAQRPYGKAYVIIGGSNVLR